MSAATAPADPTEIREAVKRATRLAAVGLERNEAEIDYLVESASTRPARGEPGSLFEQLHAVDVYSHLPAELKREHPDESWQEVLDQVIPNRRPLETQAAAWRRAQRRAARPRPVKPKREQVKARLI